MYPVYDVMPVITTTAVAIHYITAEARLPE